MVSRIERFIEVLEDAWDKTLLIADVDMDTVNIVYDKSYHKDGDLNVIIAINEKTGPMNLKNGESIPNKDILHYDYLVIAKALGTQLAHNVNYHFGIRGERISLSNPDLEGEIGNDWQNSE